MAFDDNRHASLVFGQYDQNLAKLERRLGVIANANGNHVTIKGTVEACEHARLVLENLYARVELGQPVSLGDVDGAIEEGAMQGTLFPKEDEAGRVVFEQIGTRRRGTVRARNTAQDLYLRALKRHELVFAEGPAGTGKTWLAVGYRGSSAGTGGGRASHPVAAGASKPASGSASCPATCATRSILICGRSTTRSPISWMPACSNAACRPA